MKRSDEWGNANAAFSFAARVIVTPKVSATGWRADFWQANNGTRVCVVLFDTADTKAVSARVVFCAEQVAKTLVWAFVHRWRLSDCAKKAAAPDATTFYWPGQDE
jgi:hypothetical protein